jgi:hypothetical protein
LSKAFPTDPKSHIQNVGAVTASEMCA